MAYIPDEAIDRMYEDLSSGARDLYTFLCRCRNQTTGKCCPSVSTTQNALKLSRARVFVLRKELAVKGWAEFDGNYAIRLFGFGSLKNKTIHEATKEDSGATAESLENETAESEESRKQDSPSLENKTVDVELAAVIPFSVKSLENKTVESETAPSLENETVSLENKTKKSRKQDLHIGRTSKGNQQTRTSKDMPASPAEGEASKLESEKSARKKTQPPKSHFHNHPSVNAYREILGFRAINAAQATLIAQATGVEVTSPPEDWLRFLVELAETGNKHTYNVRVMVLAFNRYKINVSLAEALRLAWDEAQGRSGNGGFNDARTNKTEKNEAAQGGDHRTTEDFGIRDCKVI